MSNNPPNPYESPEGVEPKKVRRSPWGWHLIPAGIVGLLACIAGAVAIVATVFVSRWVMEAGKAPWQCYVIPFIASATCGC